MHFLTDFRSKGGRDYDAFGMIPTVSALGGGAEIAVFTLKNYVAPNVTLIPSFAMIAPKVRQVMYIQWEFLIPVPG